MARDPENDERDESEGDGDKPERASRFQIWFEEAWEGWLKSVLMILAIAGAYVVYKFDLVTENVAGLALVLAVLVGTLASVAVPAWPMIDRSPSRRAMFLTASLLALVGAGYPALRAVIRPSPLAEGKLTAEGQSVTLKTSHAGPYELAANGHLKAGGEQEASYGLVVTGGGGEDRIDDSLERRVVRVRVSRKGGTSSSVQESNEKLHPLANVRGEELKVTAERLDTDKLEDGLIVEILPAGLNPIAFWVLCGIAFLLGVGLDTKLTDQKGKARSYLATGIGMMLVFSIFLPTLTTPHSIVRPGVDALIRAVFLGALPGWLFGAIGRVMFGPKPKKAAKK